MPWPEASWPQPAPLNLREIRAVIFDMDGLLIDSERFYLKCFSQACAEQNYAAIPDVYLRCVGTNWQMTRDILREGYGPKFPYQAVTDRCRELYQALCEDSPVPVKEGAVNLLDWIFQQKVPMSVATSTEEPKAVDELRRADLLDYFQQIVGGDSVANSKPSPDIYLKTAAVLNVPSNTCLVLEDSNNGVRAAHAAGMIVIQVPDLVEPAQDVIRFNHRILRSLSEVLGLLQNSAAD